MEETPILGLPYPTGTDRIADGDDVMKALAERLEQLLAAPHINGYINSLAVPTNTPIPFTIEEDTEAAWDPTINSYRCPRDGIYRAAAMFQADSSGIAAGQNIILQKNGVGCRYLYTNGLALGQFQSIAGSAEVKVNAGDTLAIAVNVPFSTNPAGATSPSTHFSIDWIHPGIPAIRGEDAEEDAGEDETGENTDRPDTPVVTIDRTIS